MQNKIDTQEKIIKSATELFLEKGYDRTSVRDIASKANINVSLMNYYFRSKEILFETIINLLIGKASGSLKDILDFELELNEKIRQYICKYIDMLISNPLLISFILAVLNRNPEKLTKLKVVDNLYNTENFAKQLEEEYKKGKIRKVNPEQFYLNMLSLITLPFAIKNIINDRNNFSQKEFNEFIKERKEIIYNTLICYLKP
ncbi:MAG: TetR/AcrR family transcriptional regulator [Bacteroidales bacterium]|nr:TetR/AcrR family transcriptional regulator [Bacteroidales bacterium]